MAIRGSLMRRSGYRLAALTVAALLRGCGGGFIYTHTLEPLTLDMKQTPMAETEKTGAIKHLSLRKSSISVEWSSNAIGDIARKHGLQKVFFADIETLAVLGVWRQRTVHVYGK